MKRVISKYLGMGVVGFLLAGMFVMPLVAVSAEQLVVYSGRGEKFTRPVVKAFQKRTGIRTQALVGGSTNLLARIQEEGERTQADVFLTNYAGVLEQARKRNLLQPYESPVLKAIPKEYIGPDSMWVGASARARAIVYNKNLVKPEQVTGVLDIADPKWKGKLAITESTNGSFIGGLATMLGQFDEPTVRRFLAGIKENAGENIFPKHTPIVSAVERGEVALGLINHYYFYRAISKNPKAPLGVIFPDKQGGGVPTTITGLAILKHGKNIKAARLFLDYVLSEEGQKIFAEVNFEFPVRKGVKVHPLLQKSGSVNLAPVNHALKVDQIDKAITLIKEVGMH